MQKRINIMFNIMRTIKIFAVGSILFLFFIRCETISNGSMQNINEFCCAYNKNDIENKLHKIKCLYMRTATRDYDGYALNITPNNVNENVFNVLVRVNRPRFSKNNSIDYHFKIINDDSLCDTTFHSLKDECKLFSDTYRCEASSVIDLIELCSRYCFTKIEIGNDSSIYIETPDCFLYNIDEMSKVGDEKHNRKRLCNNWICEKKT